MNSPKVPSGDSSRSTLWRSLDDRSKKFLWRFQWKDIRGISLGVAPKVITGICFSEFRSRIFDGSSFRKFIQKIPSGIR